MTGRRIVDRLIRERDTAYGNGIYVPTQIQFAWNSNHMEGSTLTARQTAQLFERDLYREHILLPAGGGNLDYTYNDRWDEHALDGFEAAHTIRVPEK